MSGHAPAHAEAHGSGHGHHRNYVRIWVILVGLLVVSVVGPMFGIRVVTLITAFGIALVKAYMVATNFMHLDIEKPIVRFMLAIALAFMVILYSGTAPDIEKDKGRSWQKDEGFHPVEKVGHSSDHAPSGHDAVTPAPGDTSGSSSSH
jgi:caa(3)-type oxidase subunit IV